MPGLPALYTGDAVYGSDRRLRMWLEQKGMSHVLAIKSNEKLWVWPGKGPRQVRADRLAALVDASHWQRRSAGDGAKGPRVYDWAVVEIRPLGEPGKGYWLLARAASPSQGSWPITCALASQEPPSRNW